MHKQRLPDENRTETTPSERQLLLLLGFYWKRIGALPPLTGKECAIKNIFSLPLYVILVNLVILDIGKKNLPSGVL